MKRMNKGLWILAVMVCLISSFFNAEAQALQAELLGSLVFCGVVICHISPRHPNKEYPSISINIR